MVLVMVSMLVMVEVVLVVVMVGVLVAMVNDGEVSQSFLSQEILESLI